MKFQLLCADAIAGLQALPAESVDCCVTSPPYWGLRDYGIAGQIGLERNPESYVSRLVDVFRAVRRVLRRDGTLWLNLGDSYAGSSMTGGTNSIQGEGSKPLTMFRRPGNLEKNLGVSNRDGIGKVAGLKAKDLVGIPWRVAFALQADGWYLRSDIIWAKPNPMPESVTDRPTKAHEYIFLLAQQQRYTYDAGAIAENTGLHINFKTAAAGKVQANSDRNDGFRQDLSISQWRNIRTVWTLATEPNPEAHFAMFPEALVSRCILAGCPDGGTVLDPFCGAGTSGIVALRHGRHFVGIDLNPDYIDLARGRLENVGPLFHAETSAPELPANLDLFEAAV